MPNKLVRLTLRPCFASVSYTHLDVYKRQAMDYYRRELYFEVEYHKYLQLKFDQQWRRLKAYANSKGIRIIGDIRCV